MPSTAARCPKCLLSQPSTLPATVQQKEVRTDAFLQLCSSLEHVVCNYSQDKKRDLRVRELRRPRAAASRTGPREGIGAAEIASSFPLLPAFSKSVVIPSARARSASPSPARHFLSLLSHSSTSLRLHTSHERNNTQRLRHHGQPTRGIWNRVRHERHPPGWPRSGQQGVSACSAMDASVAIPRA